MHTSSSPLKGHDNVGIRQEKVDCPCELQPGLNPVHLYLTVPLLQQASHQAQG